MFFNFKLEPWQKDAIKNFLELAESHAAKGKQGSIFCQVGKTAKGDVIIKGAFIRNDCSTLIKSILDEYFDKIKVETLTGHK